MKALCDVNLQSRTGFGRKPAEAPSFKQWYSQHGLSLMLRLLAQLPRRFFMALVRGYQLIISPHFPSTCRYQPTCSQYALQAFEQYGAIKGLILTVHRLFRCHPWGGHGHDPPRWFGEPKPQSPPLPASDEA